MPSDALCRESRLVGPRLGFCFSSSGSDQTDQGWGWGAGRSHQLCSLHNLPPAQPREQGAEDRCRPRVPRWRSHYVIGNM